MEYYEGDNIGGIASLDVIEHYNITSLIPLTLVPGAAWFSVLLKEESGRFNLKSQMTENGRAYTYAGRFFFQNMRNELDQALAPYLDDVAILRIKDMNGRVYIIGAPGCPVTIAENGDTGQRYINENGMEYTFTVDQTFRAINP